MHDLKKRVSSIFLAGVFSFLLSVPAGFAGERTYADSRKAGDQLLRAGRFSESIHEYETALTLNPRSTAASFNIAIAYFSVNNIEGAVRALEHLLAIDPEDTEALYNLACLRLYQQDLSGARALLESALRCANCPEFRPLVDKALQYLEDLKELDPSAREFVAFLQQKQLPSLAAPQN